MIQPISAINTNSYYQKHSSFKGSHSTGSVLTAEQKRALEELLRKERNIFTSTYYSFYDSAKILAPGAVENVEGMASAFKTMFTPLKTNQDIALQAQRFADKDYLEKANFKLLDANNIIDTTTGTIEHMTYSGDILRIPAAHMSESFDFHSLAGQKPTMEGFLAEAGVGEVGDFNFSSLPNQIPSMEGFLDGLGETVEQLIKSTTEL